MLYLDIMSKVSRSDRDNARIDRNQATNPVNVEPGMEDFDWGNESESSGGEVNSGPFSQPSSSGDPSFGGPFGQNPMGNGSPPGQQVGGWGSNVNNGGFGGGGFGGGAGGAPNGFPSGLPNGLHNTQSPEPKQSTEDKFFEGLKKVTKGFFSFAGEVIKSFKTFDVVTRMMTGKYALNTGLIVAGVGLLLSIFGLGVKAGFPLLIGGLISSGIGLFVFMWFYSDAVSTLEQEEQSQEQSMVDPDQLSSDPLDDGFSFTSDDDDEWNMDDDEDEDDDLSSFGSSEPIDFSAFEETDSAVLEQSMDTALNSLNSNMGMVTRQYLYENIVSCLMNVNQNFDRVRMIDDSSDEFDAWDSIVQNSAGVFKPNGAELDSVYLISAKERLFYYQLEINRTKWLKNIDSFVQEIVSICSFNEETGAKDLNMFGVGDAVGNKVYVKIMKGETAMVAIRDAYKNVSEHINNPDNLLPVVLGLDAEGLVVWRDFKEINAILVTGMPRSGKTWFVLSLIAQMSFFMKPSELQFRILDPKERISDFRFMEIPHIRKFVSSDKGILNELRKIVREEGPRRKKIIGDAGFVNIWDYKKRNPDVDMPLLYVVIDEVITLAERMDKEVKDEFQALLLELVSQLPALGIRIFMIPHIVKDNILKKSITDLIPCRISVRGDVDHIERAVGVKNFKHKLVHQGDMVVRFNNDVPMFVHSAVLTTSNEANRELFDFLMKFWLKLDPDSYEGSLHQLHEMDSKSGFTAGKPKSDITYEVGDGKNFPVKRSSKLSSEDLNELLSKVNQDDSDKDEDGVDLWK